MSNPRAPQPQAVLRVDRVRAVDEASAQAKIPTMPPRRPSGSYAGLRDKLIALVKGTALRVPFEGSPDKARELLTCVVKDLKRKRGLLFSVRRQPGEEAYYIFHRENEPGDDHAS